MVTNKISGTKVLFFSSNCYFFKLSVPITTSKVLFDPNTSVFILHTAYANNNYRLFLGQIDLVFSAFYRPYSRKIKFKGKGYYIYKNRRNTITPQFGYSHRLYLYSYFVTVRFLSKTSIFLFGLLKSDVVNISLGIKSMRPINIFTGRGVRFSREIIYKKVGKVSSYR
jgi:ribosomal protein L6P/L9E